MLALFDCRHADFPVSGGPISYSLEGWSKSFWVAVSWKGGANVIELGIYLN
jgi:hypothetical protein